MEEGREGGRDERRKGGREGGIEEGRKGEGRKKEGRVGVERERWHGTLCMNLHCLATQSPGSSRS